MTARIGGGTVREDTTGWPPGFPHLAIEALLRRIEEAQTPDAASTVELLVLVAREAERLRARVTRLCADRLAAAEGEARAILAEAREHAERLRAEAQEMVETRLEEVETLRIALRALARVEQCGAGLRSAERWRGGTSGPDGA